MELMGEIADWMWQRPGAHDSAKPLHSPLRKDEHGRVFIAEEWSAALAPKGGVTKKGGDGAWGVACPSSCVTADVYMWMAGGPLSSTFVRGGSGWEITGRWRVSSSGSTSSRSTRARLTAT
jgi:hypothetical protein